MITVTDTVFRLATHSTSYIFRRLPTGQLEHLYYGPRIEDTETAALETKLTAGIGCTVAYGDENPNFSLDRITLEYSGLGKGDFRHSPLELKMPDGTWVTDFVYRSHRTGAGTLAPAGLPSAAGPQEACSFLEITLTDRKLAVDLVLTYTVFEDTDVIVRHASLVNGEESPAVIRKVMSFMIDLPEDDYTLITFDGAWIKEAHRTDRALKPGIYVNSSTTGASSNRHNPGIIVARTGTHEDSGACYGINLVYSGNHYEAAEVGTHGTLRLMAGINPEGFEWELAPGQRFDSPEAVLTFSPDGFNGLSAHMHDFVNAHIVRGEQSRLDRPVLLNSWEAFFFDFNTRRLCSLARKAKRLGVELFVLDDGWFSTRNDDTSGLGDYRVNTRKLPGGLGALGRRITRMGLRFGLWFEPEMVNPDSDLARAHPDWAVRVDGREPSLGRNQLVLDLCRAEVREYIVENVNRILAEAPITYVKWDMNRHITDAFSPVLARQGEFHHRYILGLYDVLGRIVAANPAVLFESCASGGNRFDLGMLRFTPQIWASDNTDPGERLAIQHGLSYLYPLSTIGAHVSQAPHMQTLRYTPLPTRFNVAAFGMLGYELDLAEVSAAEKREIRGQIEFYKTIRGIVRTGRFRRHNSSDPNRAVWQITGRDGAAAVAGVFQTCASASPRSDVLKIQGLVPAAVYRVRTFAQTLAIRTFGSLVKHALPLKFRPDGFVMNLLNRFYRLPNAVEEYRVSGALAANGIRLHQQFMGSWYTRETRILGDFGSNLFTATSIEE